MRKDIPQYKRIEIDLSDKISGGYYSCGDLLPTEQELERHYGVSRVTVRKALDNMVAKGLLTRTPRVGTMVKTTCIPPSKETILCSFTDEITAMGMTPHTTVDDFCIINATPRIAKLLELPNGARVYHFHRSRYADDRIFMRESTYMSVDLYPDISIQILSESKYGYFEKVKGLHPASNEHTVLPVLPTSEEAAAFGIDIQTPIIRVINITRFANGQIMDYTENTMNSPYYQLRYLKRYEP